MVFTACVSYFSPSLCCSLMAVPSRVLPMFFSPSRFIVSFALSRKDEVQEELDIPLYTCLYGAVKPPAAQSGWRLKDPPEVWGSKKSLRPELKKRDTIDYFIAMTNRQNRPNSERHSK